MYSQQTSFEEWQVSIGGMMDIHAVDVGGAVHCHLVKKIWKATESSPIQPVSVKMLLDTFTDTYAQYDDHDWERVSKADVDCPIIINTRNMIVDGQHRVMRAFLKGMKYINAKTLTTYPEPLMIFGSWEEYETKEIIMDAYEVGSEISMHCLIDWTLGHSLTLNHNSGDDASACEDYLLDAEYIKDNDLTVRREDARVIINGNPAILERIADFIDVEF